MSVTYTLTAPFPSDKHASVNRINKDGTLTSIPANSKISDWQEYQDWLAEGNTPNPYIPPSEPAPLTPQEKLAAAGLSVDELKTLLGL